MFPELVIAVPSVCNANVSLELNQRGSTFSHPLEFCWEPVEEVSRVCWPRAIPYGIAPQ
jgi:hypothetical protein